MKLRVQALLAAIATLLLSTMTVPAQGKYPTVYTGKLDSVAPDTTIIGAVGELPGEPLTVQADPSVASTAALTSKVYTWKGAPGAIWDTATNWIDALGKTGVPTALDSVVIPGGASVIISSPAFCKSLTFYPGISSLTANAPLIVADKLSIGKISGSNVTTATISGTVSCDSLVIERSGAGNTFHANGIINVTSGLRISKSMYNYTNTMNLNGEITVGGSVVSEGDASTKLTVIKFGSSGVLSIGGDYVTLKAHAKTDMTSGGTLSIGGAWRNENVPNFSPGAGTIIYNRDGDQEVRSVTYYNLKLAGSGMKKMDSVAVTNTLSMLGTASALVSSKYKCSASIEYKGSGPQITGPEFPSTINGELILDNSYGLTLTGNKTAIRGLTLTSGVVHTNGFTLAIGEAANAGNISGGSPSAYIEGRVSRTFGVNGDFTFPIGKNGNYRPITIRFMRKPGTSGVGVVTAEQFETPLPGVLPSDAALYTDRHWTLTQSGLNEGTFSYDLSLNATGFSYSGKPLVFHYDGTQVIPVEAEVAGSLFTARAQTSFSSFAIGERPTGTSVSAASPEAIPYGTKNITLAAVVTLAGGTTPVNTGRVEFFIDNNSVGTSGTVSNGTATLNVDPSSLAVGVHTIKALYNGDGTLPGSSSDPAGNGLLTIQRAAASISFRNLDPVYDGSVKTVPLETIPEGLKGITVKYFKRLGDSRNEVSAASLVDAGSYELEALLDNANYELPGGKTSVTGVLTIRKAIATLAFDAETLSPEYTGTPQAAVASATWNGQPVAGVTVTYTKGVEAIAAPTGAGTYMATATLVNDNLEAAPVTQSFVIRKASTLTEVMVSDGVYTGSPQGGSAMGKGADGLEEPLILTYTGTTVAGLPYESTAPPSDAGTYTATAVYAGDDNHLNSEGAAPFLIARAPASISVSGLGKVYNGQPQSAVISTEPEGLTVGVIYNGSGTLPVDAGSYTINAVLTNTNYKAEPVTSMLTIAPAGQTIRFEVLDSKTYGDGPFAVSATATSGLPVSFSIKSGPATVTDNTITISGAGLVIVRASQAGNNNYNAAVPVDQEFMVSKALATLSLDDLKHIYDGNPKPAAAFVYPGGLSGISITYNGSDAVPINAGSYVVVATLDNDNYRAKNAEGVLVIEKAIASVEFNNLNPGYDGSIKAPTVNTIPAGLDGLTIRYFKHLNGSPVEVTAEEVIGVGTYDIEITLSHPNYRLTDDAPVTAKLEISKAGTTTVVNAPDAVYNGHPKEAIATVEGVNGLKESLLVYYTGKTFRGDAYNSDAAPAEAGTYTATAVYEGSDNYLSSQGSKAFTIARAEATIEVSDLEAICDGTPKRVTAFAYGVGGREDILAPAPVLQYMGLPYVATVGTYSSAAPPTLPGIYTVTATFAGNNNYEPANETASVRIYAKPDVSLSTPQPLPVGQEIIITATPGPDATGVQWQLTSGGVTTKEEGNTLRITASSPAVVGVSVTFKDALGQVKPEYTSEKVYAVFYDPAAGFVTGGGWITSPEEKRLPFMQVSGKANFGFVSKYEKGKNVPTGNTEFQFQAGGMNFRSTAYEWLVIAGARAQYKGTGTVNGSGNYGFMLTAVDGELAGSADLFRIKIWDKNRGDALVYDNQYGSDDDALLSTALGGGSVVIHVPPAKKSTTTVAAEARAAEAIAPTPLLKVFPNPSVSGFSIRVESGNSKDPVSLRVLDLSGRTVEVINQVAPGQTYTIGGTYRPGIYFVELVQGGERKVVKLLKTAD